MDFICRWHVHLHKKSDNIYNKATRISEFIKIIKYKVNININNISVLL